MFLCIRQQHKSPTRLSAVTRNVRGWEGSIKAAVDIKHKEAWTLEQPNCPLFPVAEVAVCSMSQRRQKAEVEDVTGNGALLQLCGSHRTKAGPQRASNEIWNKHLPLKGSTQEDHRCSKVFGLIVSQESPLYLL
jgi:hypothetical protein